MENNILKFVYRQGFGFKEMGWKESFRAGFGWIGRMKAIEVRGFPCLKIQTWEHPAPGQKFL